MISFISEIVRTLVTRYNEKECALEKERERQQEIKFRKIDARNCGTFVFKTNPISFVIIRSFNS